MSICLHVKGTWARYIRQSFFPKNTKPADLIVQNSGLEAKPESGVLTYETGRHKRRYQSLKKHITGLLSTVAIEDALLGLHSKKYSSVIRFSSRYFSPLFKSSEILLRFFGVDCTMPGAPYKGPNLRSQKNNENYSLT